MMEERDLLWQTKDKMDYPTNPLQKLRETLSYSSKDWGENKTDAFLYAIIMGWDDAYDELKDIHGWSNEDIELQKMWHDNYKKAWQLFMENENSK